VLAAMRDGDFNLPAGCSVEYSLDVVEMMRELAKISRRSGLEDYCRSYLEEEGSRPSAAQAFRAGYNPAATRASHGSWYALLDDLDMLSQAEAATFRTAGEVLAGLEKEPVTKSYKLVTLRALLHDGALRSGAPLEQVAVTARQLVLSDPRLLRDATTEEFPDLATATKERWAAYWRKWPIAAWTGELRGEPGRWFRIAGDRLVPRFSIEEELGMSFDAMVAEIVEYRLARYLIGREPPATGVMICKLGHTDGRPLLWLDRQRYPDIPEGEVSFVAEGREHRGRFVKIALNTASIPGEKGNALHALLRGWFGPSAGHPGTNHQVVLERVDGQLVMRPTGVAALEADAEILPLFPNYRVACGSFDPAEWADHGARPLTVRPRRAEKLATDRQFVCYARGDSMAGGEDPIANGDPLLLEWITGASASELVGERVLVEQTSHEGVSQTLKLLERSGTGFELASTNDAYPTIAGQADMRIAARLRRRLDQSEINALASHIGEAFKRQDVPPLYGHEFNPGNWGTSGHVSLPGHVVLFVTLEKSDQMQHGAEYVDHFNTPERFVWSSQTSAGPETKKGREVLSALETGIQIHLWVRRHKTDGAYTYLGLVVPLSHEGDRPMSVGFRLLSPVPTDIWKLLQS